MGWDIITSSVSDFYGSNDGDDNNKRGVIQFDWQQGQIYGYDSRDSGGSTQDAVLFLVSLTNNSAIN